MTEIFRQSWGGCWFWVAQIKPICKIEHGVDIAINRECNRRQHVFIVLCEGLDEVDEEEVFISFPNILNNTNLLNPVRNLKDVTGLKAL